jgi:hypothetical protein
MGQKAPNHSLEKLPLLIEKVETIEIIFILAFNLKIFKS